MVVACLGMVAILQQCVLQGRGVLLPAWVRELIDEVDGVRKVGCYWINRVSGMGIRSPLSLTMLVVF